MFLTVIIKSENYEFIASKEFTSAQYDEEPRYDEYEVEPDEDECMLVKQALYGITDQEIGSLIHGEQELPSVEKSTAVVEQPMDTMFRTTYSTKSEKSNYDELPKEMHEMNIKKDEFEDKEVEAVNGTEKSQILIGNFVLPPLAFVIRHLFSGCLTFAMTNSHRYPPELYRSSPSTWVEKDLSSHAIPYTSKMLCAIGYLPKIPPEPPPDVISSLRTNFFDGGEDDRGLVAEYGSTTKTMGQDFSLDVTII